MSCYFIGKITHNYPQSYPEGAEMSILFLKIKQINALTPINFKRGVIMGYLFRLGQRFEF